MARPKKNDETPKKFDVSKPGHAKPSATSRHLIVSNRPIMRDPMVRGETTDKENHKLADSFMRMKKLMSARRSEVTIYPDSKKNTNVNNIKNKPVTVTEEGKSLDELAAKMYASSKTSNDKPVDTFAKKSKTTTKVSKVIKSEDNAKNQDLENDNNVAVPITVGKTATKESITINAGQTNTKTNVEDDEIKLDEDDKPTFLADDLIVENTGKQKTAKVEKDSEQLSDRTTQIKDTAASESDKEDVVSEAVNEGTLNVEPTTEQEKTEEKDSINKPATEGVVDAVAQQAVAKKEQTAISKEEEAYNVKVQKLIESKQYVVPIGHLRRRKNVKIGFLIILFLIILGTVAVNFALDAEYLNFDVPYLPLTDVL